jgi:hypothetical protein
MKIYAVTVDEVADWGCLHSAITENKDISNDEKHHQNGDD